MPLLKTESIRRCSAVSRFGESPPAGLIAAAYFSAELLRGKIT